MSCLAHLQASEAVFAPAQSRFPNAGSFLETQEDWLGPENPPARNETASGCIFSSAGGLSSASHSFCVLQRGRRQGPKKSGFFAILRKIRTLSTRRDPVSAPGHITLGYSVRLISTMWKASMTSPSLMSLYPAMDIPHSRPAVTSLAASLPICREPSSPV